MEDRTFEQEQVIRVAMYLTQPKVERPIAAEIDPAKVFESVGGVEQFITETNVIPSPDRPQ